MAHYQEVRPKGRPTRELRTVNGARIRSKAEAGWKGPWFRWVIVGGGMLCCLAGVALLAEVVSWGPAPRAVLGGVYFTGRCPLVGSHTADPACPLTWISSFCDVMFHLAFRLAE
ncbi:hypothetical protein [Streptomyces sp. NPDC005969]|uniref:hypothetical protein n=1 Tax=Streptomyces sp. NPDC005969 TaxID=3156722 RepID=UPI0033F787C6